MSCPQQSPYLLSASMDATILDISTMVQNNVICVFFHLHDESEINEQHRALFFSVFF